MPVYCSQIDIMFDIIILIVMILSPILVWIIKKMVHGGFLLGRIRYYTYLKKDLSAMIISPAPDQ